MPMMIAQDGFERSVTDGWGTAPLGGPWSLGGVATRFSVSGGKARVAVASGGSEIGYLHAISSTNTHVRVALSSSTGYLGDAQSFSVGGRATAAGVYQARVRIEDGLLRLYILRGETALVSSTTITHTYVAGQVIMLDVRVMGTGPTTISAKMWLATTTEPVDYQQTATDNTSGYQVAGAMMMRASIGGAPTSTPVMSFDDLEVWDPTVNPLEAPTVTLTVTHPTGVGGNDGKIVATWPPVPGASGYETALVAGTVTSGFTADDTAATSPKEYSGLAPGVWTVAVRAKAGA